MSDILRVIARTVIKLLASLPESAQLLSFVLITLLVSWLLLFKLSRWLIPRMVQFLADVSERLLAILLYPEYLISSGRRQRDCRPSAFAYVIGGGCQSMARAMHICSTHVREFFEKRWRLSPRIGILASCVAVALVLIRPSVEETQLSELAAFWNKNWLAIQAWAREESVSK